MPYIFYPDLPPLPDVSLDIVADPFHQAKVISCDKGDVSIPNTVCTRHPVDESLVEWVKQNISSEFHTIGSNYHGTPTGGVAIPHTDGTRNWTLMWITDTGGPDVKTIFWQEKGHEIERKRSHYPKSYDDLIELATYVFEPNCWILLNGNVLHSVENLQSVRKSIQIGFWNDSEFLEKFK